MEQYKAYKFRLYPNKDQQSLIEKTFGCSRLVYNSMLYDRIQKFENREERKVVTLSELKKQYIFLDEVDSLALCSEWRNLNNAYSNFFSKLKSGTSYSKAGKPRFKNKKLDKPSYTTFNQLANKKNNTVIIHENRIKLPKLGNVKTRHKFKLNFNEHKLTQVTISREPSGKYYASILVLCDIKEKPKSEFNIGLDLGIKDLVICSNGETFDNMKFLKSEEPKIKKLQRRLSKKVKDSKRYNKVKIKLARVHEKVRNRRKDYLHKVSTRLINENQVICLETLKPSTMMKNNLLAKSIQDASWSTLVSMLEYKAFWYNRSIVKIDRYYPSSKLCSNCGFKNQNLNLSIRSWICPECKSEHDRDINAAVNILKEGLRIHKSFNEVRVGPNGTDLKPKES